jgi:hypothetical protein
VGNGFAGALDKLKERKTQNENTLIPRKFQPEPFQSHLLEKLLGLAIYKSLQYYEKY